MKKTLLLSFLFLLFSKPFKAQMYTQGNLSVTLVPFYTHDSTTCSSMVNWGFQIQKNNSFLNDTVKIKDMIGGYAFYTFVNTTGANPWSDFVVLPLGGNMSDQYLVQPGNILYSGTPQLKATSAPDTILSITGFFTTNVTDACIYDFVSGKVYIDQNSDCVFNAGDIPLQSVGVGSVAQLSSPTVSNMSAYTGTSSSGDYTNTIQKSWLTSYNVFIPSQYQFIFPSSACSPASYNFTTLPQSGVNFSLQCGSVVDVETWIGAPVSVRPIIPFHLSPVVNNTGCDSASGVLKLVLDPRVVYNAGLSSNPAASQNGDTLYWNFTNLTNLSNGAYWNSFFAGVHLTPNNTVNTGDTLCFQTIIPVQANDLNPMNNSYSLCIPVVNSYDPNVKEVVPTGTGAQGFIPASTAELTYTIHFQNTGSAPAINVYVDDTLGTNVIPASLQIIGSSHSMTPYWQSSNVVRFSFPNIMLADSNSNEAASHGFVTFKIQLQNNLAPLTQIKNTAYIYFDANPAVITNTALNTIELISGIKNESVTEFSLLPNPAKEMVVLSFKNKNTRSIVLNDLNGKQLQRAICNDVTHQLSLSGLSAGVYFISCIEENTVTVKKLIIAEN